MKLQRQAFTLIELLVVIAIISILAAILFPVFASAREKARQTMCTSNEKELALAIITYAQDFDDMNVPAFWQGGGQYFGWTTMIEPYLGQKAEAASLGKELPGILLCPDDPVMRRNLGASGAPVFVPESYAMLSGMNTSSEDYEFAHYMVTLGSVTVEEGRPVSKIPDPAGTIMLAEYSNISNLLGQTYQSTVQAPFWNLAHDWYDFQDCPGPTGAAGASATNNYCTSTNMLASSTLHSSGWNYAFADGHVKWMKPEQTIGKATAVTGYWPPQGMWTITEGD